MQHMKWHVPLFDVLFDEEDLLAVRQVLESGWLTMGPCVDAFEEAFARFNGSTSSVAVANGTAALHLALAACNIGPGDEVICPAMTFVATVNAVLYQGAVPVFADIASTHLPLLTAEKIAEKITPATKAIMVVHYAGHPCPMGPIMDLAEKHNLKVIEDCAHSPGASCEGVLTGNLGHVGCFSFFSNKNLSVGEGGMVTTRDPKLADTMRALRSHAMTQSTISRHHGHAFTYDVVGLGYNYRMDEMHAALGTTRLNHLEEDNQTRARIVAQYTDAFKQIDAIEIPLLDSPCSPVHHIYPILAQSLTARNELMRALREEGIQTSIHYQPVHRFTYYAQQVPSARTNLPHTEQWAQRELTLPLFPTMTNEQIDMVINAVSRLCKTRQETA